MFQAKNLYIKNKAEILVFENFSFTINPGEIWMIQGPNGIGKSSVYESLIGLRKIKAGSIFLNQKNITQYDPYQRVQSGMKYIAQNNALFDDLSVMENLKIFAQSLTSRYMQKSVISNAIELFDLKTLIDKKPEQLSGGQKRRVELSKMVIGNTSLILLDEPFAAIDKDRIKTLCQTFLTIAETFKCSFFINDHSKEDVISLSNYCITLGINKTTSIEKLN